MQNLVLTNFIVAPLAKEQSLFKKALPFIPFRKKDNNEKLHDGIFDITLSLNKNRMAEIKKAPTR
jgi:hypothetical protein